MDWLGFFALGQLKCLQAWLSASTLMRYAKFMLYTKKGQCLTTVGALSMDMLGPHAGQLNTSVYFTMETKECMQLSFNDMSSQMYRYQVYMVMTIERGMTVFCLKAECRSLMNSHNTTLFQMGPCYYISVVMDLLCGCWWRIFKVFSITLKNQYGHIFTL